MSGVGDWRRNAVEAASQVMRFATWYGMELTGPTKSAKRIVVLPIEGFRTLADSAAFPVSVRRVEQRYFLDIAIAKERGGSLKVLTLARAPGGVGLQQPQHVACGMTYRPWCQSCTDSTTREAFAAGVPGIAFVRPGPQGATGSIHLYIALGDRAWTTI